ncbi:MAG: hypothetical protein QG638_930, partial [Pseudomonadota bacterium]|nr:hypothetical protein [Pseudomonadota bacterium]
DFLVEEFGSTPWRRKRPDTAR